MSFFHPNIEILKYLVSKFVLDCDNNKKKKKNLFFFFNFNIIKN